MSPTDRTFEQMIQQHVDLITVAQRATIGRLRTVPDRPGVELPEWVTETSYMAVNASHDAYLNAKKPTKNYMEKLMGVLRSAALIEDVFHESEYAPSARTQKALYSLMRLQLEQFADKHVRNEASSTRSPKVPGKQMRVLNFLMTYSGHKDVLRASGADLAAWYESATGEKVTGRTAKQAQNLMTGKNLEK